MPESKSPGLYFSQPPANGNPLERLDHEMLLALVADNIAARVPQDWVAPEVEDEQETADDDSASVSGIDRLAERLEKIEAMLTLLVEQRTVKDWYSTNEVAQLLGKAEYTVREWCRQGRIRARKKPCGRGKGGEWLISHEELTRLKNEGLLPFPRPA